MPVRLCLLALAAFTMTSLAAEPKKGPINRLGKESSPYLLQHAHNPVDWYPWGPEAFEKAKKEKKLIFLSIGYSSCHWCHVMERESFEDKEVAAILNKNFVCIKVDREERPDVDEIYMTALSVMGARGGWPLSMFLTAEGKPIVGGTYWPKEDRKVEEGTIRGFKSVLAVIIELHRDKEKELLEQADLLAAQTADAMTRSARGVAIVPLNRALASGSAEALREGVDPVYGGFGSMERDFRGTKFPMPPSLANLLHQAHRDKDAKLASSVALTLDQMVIGGIYDQAGGGFHRYSTERTWTVPHFEKMLYDNAQLIQLYSEAYQNDPKPQYKRAVEESITFLLKEMRGPHGGFYSALDADSNGVEGEFYVWALDEIEKIITNKDDLTLFKTVYSMNDGPNFEEKSYILRLKKPFSAVAQELKIPEADLLKKLEVMKEKVLAVRVARERPFLDTKVLTAWNGQAIAGLATAGRVFQKADYVKSASQAADFVLAKLRTPEGRLLRTYSTRLDGQGEAKLNAYLEDYAYLIDGLLSLHDATSDVRWLKPARELTDIMIKWHGDTEQGGYFNTSSDHEKLFARPKDHHDGVQPSANGVAIRNLLRLAKKTGEAKYRVEAEKGLKQFAGAMKGNPGSSPALADALHFYLDTDPGKSVADLIPKGETKDKDPVPATGIKATNSRDVVKVEGIAGKPGANGKFLLTLKLTVAAPWHIYANPVVNDEYAGATTVVEVYRKGEKVEAKVKYPEGRVVKDEGGKPYRVYDGVTAIEVEVPGVAEDQEVRIKVQACISGENGRCLSPATIKLPIK
jgi:uncharacterized protein YyaL (SSP411 family)